MSDLLELHVRLERDEETDGVPTDRRIMAAFAELHRDGIGYPTRRSKSPSWPTANRTRSPPSPSRWAPRGRSTATATRVCVRRCSRGTRTNVGDGGGGTRLDRLWNCGGSAGRFSRRKEGRDERLCPNGVRVRKRVSSARWARSAAMDQDGEVYMPIEAVLSPQCGHAGGLCAVLGRRTRGIPRRAPVCPGVVACVGIPGVRAGASM